MRIASVVTRARFGLLLAASLIAVAALAWHPGSSPRAPVATIAPPPRPPLPAPPRRRGSIAVLTSMPAGLQGEAALVARALGPCHDHTTLVFRPDDAATFDVLARCDDAAALQIGHRYALLAREIPHTRTWRAEWILEPRH
jgi:hypothetical protein